MLCPSLLSSQNVDPETYLSDQQIDRELLINKLWSKIQETDRKRVSGLTDRDFDYFEKLMSVIINWSDEELLDLASDPIEFRKVIRGYSMD